MCFNVYMELKFLDGVRIRIELLFYGFGFWGDILVIYVGLVFMNKIFRDINK